MEPYIKGLNSMPRVVLAPIFAVWFGLGIWSKVALGVTLVFFVVFFNVYQGVREVSPILLANARMLGASRGQLLRSIYLPSAMSWVFASLHNAVGLAFVGAVVGEYLGSSQGVGYLILQAEGTFDINTVFAGIIVLTGLRPGARLRSSALVERRLMTWQPGERDGEARQSEARVTHEAVLDPLRMKLCPCAARFSRKCATPSLKSAVWNESSISWLACTVASASVWNWASQSWLLHHRDRARRDGVGQQPGVGAGLGHQLVVGDDPAHQAERQRLGRAELARGAEQVERRRQADQPRQQPAHAMLGDQAALGEGGGEHRRLTGEAQVGVERDDEAQPRRRPVDGGDDEFRDRREVGIGHPEFGQRAAARHIRAAPWCCDRPPARRRRSPAGRPCPLPHKNRGPRRSG